MTTAPTYAEAAAAGRKAVGTTSVGVIAALSASHMLNDVMQSLAPALYPVFRSEFSLSFFQVGVITLVFQITASLLQPLIGYAADRRPVNGVLPIGMGFTLVGLALLAFARSYELILVSVAVIGIGSAVFHPEASRVARAASGGRYGFAQSFFQVGGNFGQSTGPLLAAFVVVPFGQRSILAFTVLALIAVILLIGVSRWYGAHRTQRRHVETVAGPTHPRPVVLRTIAVLVILLFSKVSLSRQHRQLLHVLPDRRFRRVGAVGAGDAVRLPRLGRCGHFPRRTAGRPLRGQVRHLGLDPGRAAVHPPPAPSRPHGTAINSIAIGLVISSAFSAIVVYAQELTPGQCRRGGGALLRPVVRPGRHRRGVARYGR